MKDIPLKEIMFIAESIHGYNVYTAKRDTVVTYSSKPTTDEIAFGHVYTHYKNFRLADVLNKDRTVKQWVKDEDGRRWNYFKFRSTKDVEFAFAVEKNQ